jgi:hypothetical protein
MAEGRHASQTIVTMKGRGGMQWTAQRAASPLGDRRPGWWSQHGQHTPGVGCRYVHRDIPGHSCDQLDTQLWRAQGQHQRQSIIDAWIGINRHWA